MDRDYKAWLYCRVAQHDEAAMLRQEKLLRDSVEDCYEIIGATNEYSFGLIIDRPGLREVQIKAREGHRAGMGAPDGPHLPKWSAGRAVDTGYIHYGVSVGMLQGDGRLTHVEPFNVEHVAYYIRFENGTHVGTI